MRELVIRDMEEADLPAFRGLIVEAFGAGWNLGRFDQGADYFEALLRVYQGMFLDASTFGKVAVLGGEVVGAVLASVPGDAERFRGWQRDVAPHTLALLSAPEAERRDMVEHLSVSFQAIGGLLAERVEDYDGSLEFIAVSESAQGLGIGKMLWEEALGYFASKGVKAIYLIADSNCNFGFYDGNGFVRVGAQAVAYAYVAGRKMSEVFLYAYGVAGG